MSPEKLQPKSEKTRAEVGAQIGRIAQKIGERAAHLGREGIDVTDSSRNELKVSRSGNIIKHFKKDGTGKTVKHNTVNSEKGTVEVATDKAILGVYEDGSGSLIEENPAPEGGLRGVSLNKEQAVDVSAGALGQMRSELAQREIAYGQHQAQVVDQKIDEVLKA